MFILPCKYYESHPIVFESVASIRKHMPNEKIAIVDSDSDDKSYLNKFDKDIMIYDISNVNYTLEAFYHVYKDNPEEEFFYNIQDSVIINSDLSFIKEKDLTILRNWDSPPVPMGSDKDGNSLVDWANGVMLEHLGYPVPPVYKGVFGPIFMCKRIVMQRLEESGFFKIKPIDKYQACAMERITGIALQKLGYDLNNSLQGSGGEIYASYDETYMKKIHLLRM